MTKNEYIKAELDLFKLFISATLAAMFLTGVYNLQTVGVHVITVIIVEIGLFLALLLELWKYYNTAEKLLDEKS